MLLNNMSLNDNFAIFDLETTGLSAEKDKILEVCVRAFKGKKETHKYHSYINYTGYINPKVSSINKITSAMVCDAPDVDIVLRDIYSNLSNYIFVAHNAHEFDAKFLLAADREKFSNVKFLDTKILAKMVLPGSEKYSMSHLCNLFGINIVNQHTSRGDVDALITLFFKLLMLLDNIEDINKCIKKGSLIK